MNLQKFSKACKGLGPAYTWTMDPAGKIRAKHPDIPDRDICPMEAVHHSQTGIFQTFDTAEYALNLGFLDSRRIKQGADRPFERLSGAERRLRNMYIRVFAPAEAQPA